MKRDDLRIHYSHEMGGITRTRGFEKKGLATHACNNAFKCPHGCAYCSSAVIYRHRPVFREFGESPYDRGFAIVDVTVAERLEPGELRKLKPTDMVQVCTTSDAWAPYTEDVGRRLLARLLRESCAQVRILTKNASVVRDFDLIEEYRDRVTVSLSLTGPESKQQVVTVIEPYASAIGERIQALKEAKHRGLRVYGMLCPLLPGISDDAGSVSELLQLCAELDVEDVWAEPVNPRGRGLIYTAGDLEAAGYGEEAQAVTRVRRQLHWSAYARDLVDIVVSTAVDLGLLDRLHFLLYPSNLTDEDERALRRHREGIIWL